MTTTTLRVKTPCHGCAIRIAATPFVPVERYERTCRECGFGWSIERRTVREQAGVRMDAVDWTAASRIGVPS